MSAVTPSFLIDRLIDGAARLRLNRHARHGLNSELRPTSAQAFQVLDQDGDVV